MGAFTGLPGGDEAIEGSQFTTTSGSTSAKDRKLISSRSIYN